MASSRWKRFAFFERGALNLPGEVLEDLVPNTNLSQSLHSLPSGDAVSLVITSAALPRKSKPLDNTEQLLSLQNADKKPSPSYTSTDSSSLESMWSSLLMCMPTEAPESPGRVPLVSLHSQEKGLVSANSTSTAIVANHSSTTTATTDDLMDGLTLAFLSSRETDLVHCVDLTVRCNPSKFAPRTLSELEDLDGWRGYFSPFKDALTCGSAIITGTTERIPPLSSNAYTVVESKIVGLATCRTSIRKVHIACLGESQVIVWEDPHLYLSIRIPIASPKPSADVVTWKLASISVSEGKCCVADIQPGIVAVGMNTGSVLIFVYNWDQPKTSNNQLRMYLRIPPPPAEGVEVVSVKLATTGERACIFCCYRLKSSSSANSTSTVGPLTSPSSHSAPSAGVCCYEIPFPSKNITTILPAPSARHDLDGRYVASKNLVDLSSLGLGTTKSGDNDGSITIARPDGLYSYSKMERTGVAPIDGTKIAFCLIPNLIAGEARRQVAISLSTGHLALVASTDAKSGRDAVDIYDCTNKLVAFHLLLSPGHRAICGAALATAPTVESNGFIRGGTSSAIVLTSGGSLISFTEKLTEEKISLLIQKNLYSAAIVVAYADPATDATVVTSLYRQYAEHLYRKGDYGGAIDQYCHTIGSLESSHVIFRFLDAPKIPLLVKYLEKLRSRDLLTPIHNELLRTCFLKLNDIEAADAVTVKASSSVNNASFASILSNLSSNVKEALTTICTLEAQQAAEILMVHGAALARPLPRETAGVIVALCLGTYSPKIMAEAALIDPGSLKKMVERGSDERPRVHEPYPFHLFLTSFLENPKMLRLILTHCNRNKCFLTGSLRRTLLELTLAEWNQAKRVGDGEAETLRRKEAVTALTDSHHREIGDYDALVIVQQAGFEEGELLLYERLQMTPMLLDRYAKDGTQKSRRQMLAMCQGDPESLADVLGHFVQRAAYKINEEKDGCADEDSEDNDVDSILDDIHEALSLARRQGVLPPVRVARILAGEGTGQFRSFNVQDRRVIRRTIPLAVALDYVGSILEQSRKDILRLRSEVEEYNLLCNVMKNDIDILLRASNALPQSLPIDQDSRNLKLSIDDLYAKVLSEVQSVGDIPGKLRESFWRDMSQSEDTFDTIARYFAKGVIR